MANMTAVFRAARTPANQRAHPSCTRREEEEQGVRLGRPPTLSQELVARVVSERAAGRTLQAIADALGRDGIQTAHAGVRWRPCTIASHLEVSLPARPDDRSCEGCRSSRRAALVAIPRVRHTWGALPTEPGLTAGSCDQDLWR